MFDKNYNFTVVDKFLKFVKYDTQSNEEETRFPSTEKQLVLLKELVKELQEIGLKDAEIDQYGYVYATLPSNTNKDVPVIGFMAHADTSPAVSGENVNPIIHKNYQGGDIVLPKDKTKVIKFDENPDLKDMLGYDIITTDGTTLLGADDKAGIASIIDAMNYLIKHPDVKHGTIRVCFSPDEEVARGTEHFDVPKFNAKYAYTVDGGQKGEIETETFCADMVVLKFVGKNVHPGYAKDKMVNSIKVASYFIGNLPKDKLSPETTEKREGFVHCVNFQGTEESTTLKIIIRDFIADKLKEYEDFIEGIAKKAVESFPGAVYEFEVKEQYRNMKYVLDEHPQVEQYAVESMERIGITPIKSAIRGGTDGARLSFEGLPTPNLFAGGHNFHSILEWVAVQDMQEAVKTIVEIAKIWEEKS